MRDEMEEMGERDGRAQADGDAQEYLTKLRSLAGELDRAMGAIVARELPSLQHSVQEQQAMCARLGDLRRSAAVRRLLDPGTKQEGASGDICSDLSREMKEATELLLARNRRYSALLAHSGETLRLLAGLYRGCPIYQDYAQGHSRSAMLPQAGRQSWHCEI